MGREAAVIRLQFKGPLWSLMPADLAKCVVERGLGVVRGSVGSRFSMRTLVYRLFNLMIPKGKRIAMGENQFKGGWSELEEVRFTSR